MAKTKVLIVSHTAQLGGAERVLLRFLAEQTSFDLVLICPAGPLADLAQKAGVPTHLSKSLSPLKREENPFWPLAFWGRLLGSFVEISCLIFKEKPDLVQANGFSTMPYVCLPTWTWGRPLLWHMHDFKTGLRNRLAAAIFDFFSTRILAVSEAVAFNLRTQGIAPEKIRVLYNHVNPAQLQAGDGALSFKLAELKADGSKLVGMMGSLEERKGMREAIEALALIPTEPIKLVLAGGTHSPSQERYLAQLKDLVAQKGLNGRVILLGPIDSLAEFYQGIDLFLHYPKTPDPLPTVLLEALSLGLPVLANQLGGNPECLGQGQWGRLIAPDRIDLLATALTQPQPPLDGYAKIRFLEQFSLKSKETEFSLLYRELLEALDAD